ncbi:fido domain-containing protein [Lasiosphaeria ovina]|uniref:Fido domain-containing protein n=1 Tax=Lasiosphaeria ovina TaxID=92902 RepID=A0AAE0K6D9_9PEZI|nr:fido domain-containing protein [Lasiosphaeria ovina]
MQMLSDRFADTFSSGWPPFCGGEDPNFTIRLAEPLEKAARNLNLPADPAAIIDDAREASQPLGPPAFSQVWETLEQSLITLVHGSNTVESAGSSQRITANLCRAVSSGQQADASIDELDAEYSDRAGVVQSRGEVVQHAEALAYMLGRVVLDNAPVSEALLRETHCVLCGGVGDADDVAPGRYREHEVAVSNSKPGETKKNISRCMRASVVLRYMRELVENLGAEMVEAERRGIIDPYSLAARYRHQFVMVHPFGDGNGRMSRIVLNVLLLKYAGHVAPFGSEGGEKDEYLNIVGNIVGRGKKLPNLC